MSRHTIPPLTDIDTEVEETIVTEDGDGSLFDSTPIQTDQRKSYRYPAQSGQHTATIRHRRRKCECTLVEESAGGVALDTPAQFNLHVDDEVELELYSGWYRARVVHIQPSEGGNRRVGLQRIAAMADNGTAADIQTPKSGWSEAMRKCLMLFFLVGAAMAAGGGLMNWLSPVGDSTAEIPAGFAPRPENDELANVLDSVNVLTQEDVAEHLKLSGEQRTTLDGIFVGASNRLSELREQTRDQSPDIWYRESQAVVNDVLENVLCSLTDEQVARWREILIYKRQLDARQG